MKAKKTANDDYVSHRNHSHQIAILIANWNTPHLFVAHFIDHIHDAIVGSSGVNID
jgi:hypothetical protein